MVYSATTVSKLSSYYLSNTNIILLFVYHQQLAEQLYSKGSWSPAEISMTALFRCPVVP